VFVLIPRPRSPTDSEKDQETEKKRPRSNKKGCRAIDTQISIGDGGWMMNWKGFETIWSNRGTASAFSSVLNGIKSAWFYYIHYNKKYSFFCRGIVAFSVTTIKSVFPYGRSKGL
jgi:hypothetical protein